jgi:predicted flap endonuclease-1-like 5' DNA nuclease
MTYLFGKMTIFLLTAGVFGIVIGWLLKRFFAIKHSNTQRNIFDAERKIQQQDILQLESNWQKKYSSLNKKLHTTKKSLETQEQENLRLLNSIKTNKQALDALNMDFTTLKSEKLRLQDQLSLTKKQNRVPDDLQKVSGIGSVNEQILKENGITSYAQLAAFNEEDEKRCGDKLGAFAGRISSEGWVEQAKILHKEKYGENV